MNNTEIKIEFTGEFFVPGKSGERIESDHIERYAFACKYVTNKAVLDIACGVGYSAPLMVRAGAREYDGVDINKQLVDNANGQYGAAGIKYYQGDICSYNPNKCYDIVTCFETIEHVRDYRGALSNIFKLLKADGMLVISSPNRPVTSPDARDISDRPSNQYHTQEFTVQELKSELISAGFVVDANDVYGQRISLINVRNKHIRRLLWFVFGDPSIKFSPKVLPLGKKVPRYFIIVARKPVHHRA